MTIPDFIYNNYVDYRALMSIFYYDKYKSSNLNYEYGKFFDFRYRQCFAWNEI